MFNNLTRKTFENFQGSIYLRPVIDPTVILLNHNSRVHQSNKFSNKTFRLLFENLPGKQKFFNTFYAKSLLNSSRYSCVEIVSYPKAEISLMYFYSCLNKISLNKKITKIDLREDTLRVTSKKEFSTYVFKEVDIAERFYEEFLKNF